MFLVRRIRYMGTRNTSSWILQLCVTNGEHRIGLTTYVERKFPMSTVMAKKKPTKPEVGSNEPAKGGGRKTAPIQVEKQLARWAAVIAAHDGTTQSDLVSPVLKPFLKLHYERVQKEIEENVRRMNEPE